MWGMKFEDGLRRLEEIVSTMDEGKVSLDEALNLFKDGLLLTKELSQQLDEIEQKVEILIKKDDGSIEKKPFLQEEA
ncbi:MAG TPA: exodeoxyribonuclease VII small subunit [Deltaproteobacteria bacterium]|nr:exodeoxyribonuclease VII small subunit [Deltaproteobacteria bacterium]